MKKACVKFASWLALNYEPTGDGGWVYVHPQTGIKTGTVYSTKSLYKQWMKELIEKG